MKRAAARPAEPGRQFRRDLTLSRHLRAHNSLRNAPSPLFAHSRSSVGKFGDNGKFHYSVVVKAFRMLARTPRPALDRRIDAAQCKPISVQNKPPASRERSGKRCRPIPGARIAGDEILSGRALGWTSKVRRAMGLSCRHRRFNQEQYQHKLVIPMFRALVVLFRIVAGLVILAATWFVLDKIHDRNTEIIVATIGLLIRSFSLYLVDCSILA